MTDSISAAQMNRPATQGRPLDSPPAAQETALRQVSSQLEALFLAEMLKASGFGEGSETFGGGEGEAQFTSFLQDVQAERMVQAGGIGLAESLFNALKEMPDDL